MKDPEFVDPELQVKHGESDGTIMMGLFMLILELGGVVICLGVVAKFAKHII